MLEQESFAALLSQQLTLTSLNRTNAKPQLVRDALSRTSIT
jgi:hypothetical protein